MDPNSLFNYGRSMFRPPPKLSLTEWADAFAVLSAESAAEPGKWRTIPYQRGIQDAVTDPRIERITVMKSARVGYTKIIGNAIGYFIHYDPCPIMVVQPTESDAEQYSKEEIAPMIRDNPVLAGRVSDSKSRDSSNTILQKLFPGGSLSLVGANSPRGFRRVSRRVVIFDEVDGYPVSAGLEGDQIKLGIKRTEYYWNRKIIAGSTPTTNIHSRIKKLFDQGDQRYYFVPCPHCLEMQVLKFPNLKWPDGKPDEAGFECVNDGCKKIIEHRFKKWMIERGEWRQQSPNTNGHASFHIWSAYSYSPNSTWGDIAKEFLDAKAGGQEELKTFINVVLGEVWEEKGEAPDWERIYDRRQNYGMNRPPDPSVFLTAGVDVQADRIELEIVAWARDRQSWSIDYRVIHGDTASDIPWQELSKVLHETWKHPRGLDMRLAAMCVDSGFNTQHVYNWCRRQSPSRVFAIKGSDSLQALIGKPSKVDITVHGRTISRGFQIWPAGVSVAKTELYSVLRLPSAVDGGAYPRGYCHFPEYDSEFFKQLTAEQLVRRVAKGGYPKYEWEKTRARNEALDCRIYARIAAAAFGLDRFTDQQWDRLTADFGESRIPKPKKPVVQAEPGTEEPGAPKPPPKPKTKRRESSFW